MEDWEWGCYPRTSGFGTWDRFLNFELVHELFHYRGGHLYRNDNDMPAARPRKKDGYMQVSIQRRTYLEHRVIFLGEHGYVEDEIDHINRIRHDNRVENLRECDRSENLRNRAPYGHRRRVQPA